MPEDLATPLPQTEAQREVEARIEGYADQLAPRHGLRRREVPRLERRHGRRLPRDERGVRTGVRT